MDKLYMIQKMNGRRDIEPIELHRSYKEAEDYLLSRGYKVTSNPWLGTVYTYEHKVRVKSNIIEREDARIISVIPPKTTYSDYTREKLLEEIQELKDLIDTQSKSLKKLEQKINNSK